jgi:predicted ArsR family transcriptional regulator
MKGGSDPIAALALLDEPTRGRLYELVAASHDEVSRDQAGLALGISRELAAFHLDRLVEAGLLETAYRRLGGRSGPGAGRPAKLYRRAQREVTVSLPPRRYEAIADLFAEGLDRLGDSAASWLVTDAVNGVAHARGKSAGTEARDEAGPRPSGGDLRQALLSLLARAGYEPKTDEAGTVTLCNCPYRAVSAEHRDLMCGTNLAWAEGVLEGLGNVSLTPELAIAPGRCCVVFAAEA